MVRERWILSARDAGVQRVAPGAAKRSRGLSGVFAGRARRAGDSRNSRKESIRPVMSFERRITVAHSYTNLLYHIVFATSGTSYRFQARILVTLDAVARFAGSHCGESTVNPRLRFAAPGASAAKRRYWRDAPWGVSCTMKDCAGDGPPAVSPKCPNPRPPAALRCAGGYTLVARFAGSETARRLFKM